MITPDGFSAKQETDGRFHIRVLYTTPDGKQRELHCWGRNSNRKRRLLIEMTRTSLHSLGVQSPV